jgi:outer membrane protein OmpA-like peptidoglycan-associated protein
LKRLTIAVAALAAVFCAALIVLSLAGYRSLKSMRADLHTLSAKVDSATQLAQQESAAALAASKQAQQARVQAEAAAMGRQQALAEKHAADAGRLQAEVAKQAAVAGRSQALAKAQEATENAQEAQAQMLRMREERKRELDQMQQALNRVVPTHRTSNGMVMVLQDANFRFPFDSSKLSEKDRELLSRIAGILLVSKGYGLSIYGYTDDVGTAEYNQKLSVRRAKAVKDYLAQAGIDPSIMSVKGFGKTNPLVPGDSPAARAQNRRVEIALADSSIRYVGKAGAQ